MVSYDDWGIPLTEKMIEAFTRVFVNTDPFGEPFSLHCPHRLLLCPTDAYSLTEQQLRAIAKSAGVHGESEAFISTTENLHGGLRDPLAHHWHIILNNNEVYQSLPQVVENALYSVQGRWGVIISHEMHAVVGGDDLFIESFKESYPEWENQLSNLLEIWREYKNFPNANTSWIPILTKHIYGRSYTV
jgi:hypothetical protein